MLVKDCRNCTPFQSIWKTFIHSILQVVVHSEKWKKNTTENSELDREVQILALVCFRDVGVNVSLSVFWKLQKCPDTDPPANIWGSEAMWLSYEPALQSDLVPSGSTTKLSSLWQGLKEYIHQFYTSVLTGQLSTNACATIKWYKAFVASAMSLSVQVALWVSLPFE